MYENMSYEGILERMLNRIPNTFDKREGSIIYDALAPAAMEIMSMYLELENIMNETFADTASREYLIKRAAERGIIPDPAAKAVLKAKTKPETLDIAIGSRFSFNELNYAVTSKIESGFYMVECETAGTIGNKYFGNLIPIDYIDGLESIETVELLIPGEDEESTDSIRKRYFDTFGSQAYGGNKKDYIQKTNAISGVGSTKVTPVWNGGGTVLLTILDSEFNKASSTLVQKVQNEIDPTQDGKGVGIAPIGHIVTVKTAEEVTINISTNVTVQTGYIFDDVKNTITEAVENYLLGIRKEWADEEASSVVRISQIEARIMNVDKVLDVTGTKINGTADNCTLTAYQIPILGVVTNG